MRKETIVADSTLVAQVAEGRTVDVIVDDTGKVYIPLMTLKFITGGSAKPAATGKTKTEVPAETATEDAPVKKGRGGAKASPAAEAESGVDRKTLHGIFTRYDGGDLEVEDAEKELSDLVDDKKAKKALIAVLTEFTNNQALEVDEVVDLALKAANGEEVTVAPDEADAEEVDVADLEVGDKVTVSFFESEDFDEDDYVGEVVSKGRGGKVMIHYEGDKEPYAYDPKKMGTIMRHTEKKPAEKAKSKVKK